MARLSHSLSHNAGFLPALKDGVSAKEDDKHNQSVTDGDDLRAELQDENDHRKSHNDGLSHQGQFLSANVPLDHIVWMPANALSLEVIVQGDPEELARTYPARAK